MPIFSRRGVAIITGLFGALPCFLAFAALAGESITIGYSTHSEATALSNGRRMVRTSDDRRIVVYQDSAAGKPFIRWTYSNDGRAWSAPAIIVQGSFPALAVSNENWIYLVWQLEDHRGIGLAYSTDGAVTWEPALPIRPEGNVSCQVPVVEATAKAVHVVWQQKKPSGLTEKICHQRFTKDLSQALTPVVSLGAENFAARFPVIAGDLEFKSDFMHLVWSEYPTAGGQPRIVYCNFIESAGPPDWGFMAPAVVPGLSGKSHPSISVRHYELGENPSAFITMASVDSGNGRLVTALLYANTKGIQEMRVDSITVGPNSSTSVDDIYLSSCAIVWQSRGHIHYGQTRDEHIMTNPPLRVCADAEARCMNPNVCYKTFRRDSIDVVWTDGDHAPYRLMYRRMAKQYGPVAVDGAQPDEFLPRNFSLSQNHPNPFRSAATSRVAGNPATFIVYSLPQPSQVELKVYDVLGHEVRVLVNDRKPAGGHRVQFDGQGLPGGLYFYRLRAGEFVATRKMLIVR
jgi:hypothetical protein